MQSKYVSTSYVILSFTYLPTYAYVLTYLATKIDFYFLCLFKFQLMCQVATFNYLTCHNLKQS
jgi:hypothetical protein